MDQHGQNVIQMTKKLSQNIEGKNFSPLRRLLNFIRAKHPKMPVISPESVREIAISQPYSLAPYLFRPASVAPFGQLPANHNASFHTRVWSSFHQSGEPRQPSDKADQFMSFLQKAFHNDADQPIA